MGRSFCLGKDTDRSHFLKQDHQYYFQVQVQIFVTQAQYCDFVVWACNEFNTTHVERIQSNITFFQTALICVNTIYVQCVLPELLGKWHSVPGSAVASADSGRGFCYCGEEDDGDMLQCQSGRCSVQKSIRVVLLFLWQGKYPRL